MIHLRLCWRLVFLNNSQTRATGIPNAFVQWNLLWIFASTRNSLFPIEATATDNNQSNTQHILEIQKCISVKTGLTRLRDADLSRPMLKDLGNIAMPLLIIHETVT